MVDQSTGRITGVNYSGKFIRGIKEFYELFVLRILSEGRPKNTETRTGMGRRQSSSSDKIQHTNSFGPRAGGSFTRSLSSPNMASSLSEEDEGNDLEASQNSGFCLNPSSRFESLSISGRVTPSPELYADSLSRPVTPSVAAASKRQPRGDKILPSFDAPFLAFLQSQLVKAGLKVFLYFHVCGNSTMAPGKLMTLLNVEERNDRKILEYLTSIVCRQLDLANVSVEYLP